MSIATILLVNYVKRHIFIFYCPSKGRSETDNSLFSPFLVLLYTKKRKHNETNKLEVIKRVKKAHC